MSFFGERSAPLDGAKAVATLEPVTLKRAYHQPSRELRNWWSNYAMQMGQQDSHGPPDGMAAACVPILAVDADAAKMTGREQEGRASTARCLRCAHTQSAREVRPCWRGRRPDFRVCDAVHLRLSGRATWHETQFGDRLTRHFFRCAGSSSWWTRTWTSFDCAWCAT